MNGTKFGPYVVAVVIMLGFTLVVALVTGVANSRSNSQQQQQHKKKSEQEKDVRVVHHVILSTTASMQYAHNAMLTAFEDGELIVAYQAAPTVEGQQEQRLLFHSSSNGGVSWRRLQSVIGDGSAPVWGPCFLVNEGTLYLFYARAPAIHIIGGSLEAVSSSDRGLTWSRSSLQLLDIRYWNRSMKVANNQPIRLRSDGSFLLAFNSVSCMHSIFSSPYGCLESGEDQVIAAGVLKGWAANLSDAEQYGMIKKVPTPFHESTLAECTNGTILQLFRSNRGVLYRSISSDAGRSWSEAVPTDLPNPNSKVNLIARSDEGHVGELLLAYNPSSSKQRTPLVVSTSKDCGESWKELAVLEGDENIFYHYPTMVQHQKTVYTVYTVSSKTKRQFFQLKLAKFDL